MVRATSLAVFALLGVLLLVVQRQALFTNHGGVNLALVVAGRGRDRRGCHLPLPLVAASVALWTVDRGDRNLGRRDVRCCAARSILAWTPAGS